MSDDEGGMVVARIRIERRLMPDGGDLVMAEFDDGHDEGEMPAAVELLGIGLYGDEDDE